MCGLEFVFWKIPLTPLRAPVKIIFNGRFKSPFQDSSDFLINYHKKVRDWIWFFLLARYYWFDTKHSQTNRINVWKIFYSKISMKRCPTFFKNKNSYSESHCSIKNSIAAFFYRPIRQNENSGFNLKTHRFRFESRFWFRLLRFGTK